MTECDSYMMAATPSASEQITALLNQRQYENDPYAAGQIGETAAMILKTVTNPRDFAIGFSRGITDAHFSYTIELQFYRHFIQASYENAKRFKFTQREETVMMNAIEHITSNRTLPSYSYFLKPYLTAFWGK